MTYLERLQIFDIEQTLNLSEEFNKLYGVSNKFNRAKLRSILEASFLYQNSYYCLVMKYEAKVVGLLVGVCFEGPYFDDRVASELGWYIQEEYRGRLSITMLRDFESWAKNEAKADYVAMTYTEEMSNLDKLYLKLGYMPAEHTYKKSLA